jgi:PST family polysaccharide transporter
MMWFSLRFLLIPLTLIPTALLARSFRFRVITARTIVARIIGGATGISMALMGFGVWSLVAQNLVDLVIGVLILWFKVDWFPKVRFSFQDARELLGFGLNLTGFKVANYLNRHFAHLLIGYFLGSQALGYYAVGYRILTALAGTTIQICQRVALPALSNLQTDRTKIRQAFCEAMRLFSTLGIPVFAGVAILAPELVTQFFGEKWIPTIPVLQWLMILGFLHVVFAFNGSLFSALGRPDLEMKIGVVNALANIMVVGLVVQSGITAVSAGITLRAYLLAPIALLAVLRLIQLSPWAYLRQHIPAVIAAAGMVLTVGLAKVLVGEQGCEWISLLCYVALGVVTYTALIAVIARGQLKEVGRFVRGALEPGVKPLR